MPLLKGNTKEVISKNISEMEKSGHPHSQSVAAALNAARHSDKRNRKNDMRAQRIKSKQDMHSYRQYKGSYMFV